MNYPPQIPEDTVPFEDGLRDIIPEKIEEVLEQLDNLTARYEEEQKVIQKLALKGDLDEPSQYFWNLWNELKYKNFFILKKWLWYWIGLYDKLPRSEIKHTPFLDKAILDKADVLRAKERPIEQFYGGKLTGTVRLCGLCPFHKENSPSFFIFTNSNTFHCFGCQAGGDVIEFVMKKFNIDFKEALKMLL